MIELTLFFQVCFLIFNGEDPAYDCSVNVFIAEDQEQLQAWWLYAGGDPETKAYAFWSGELRVIALYNNDLGSFSQMWNYAFCYMQYYYGDRTDTGICSRGFGINQERSLL